MMEKQPHTFSRAQAVLNVATSGPSSRHMISGLVSIDSPCRAYSGNTTRSSVGIPFLALVTRADDALGLPRQVRLRRHHRQLQLHQAQHHAVRGTIQSTKSGHARQCREGLVSSG